jgi:cytidylate kinase
VLLNADIATRNRRIITREGGESEKRKWEMLERERSEAARYKKYYNIDLKDVSIYDVVIDTSDKSPNDILDIIICKIRE